MTITTIEDSKTRRLVLERYLVDRKDEIIRGIRSHAVDISRLRGMPLPAMADEIYAEVCARVLVKADSYDPAAAPDGVPRAWIMQFASNVAREWTTTERRKNKHSATPPASGDMSDDDGDWFDRVTGGNVSSSAGYGDPAFIAEERDNMHQMLSMLPPKQRELISLAQVHGLDFREIGKMLGMTEGAARTAHHRAIDRLRSQYEQRGIRNSADLIHGIDSESHSTGDYGKEKKQ